MTVDTPEKEECVETGDATCAREVCRKEDCKLEILEMLLFLVWSLHVLTTRFFLTRLSAISRLRYRWNR